LSTTSVQLNLIPERLTLTNQFFEEKEEVR